MILRNDVIRTVKNLEKYFSDIKQGRTTKDLRRIPSIWKGDYWIIVPNQYPYDRIASVHDLLVPRRLIGQQSEMSKDELAELIGIKESSWFKDTYDCILENVPRRRTLKHHYHLHLIKYKRISDYE